MGKIKRFSYSKFERRDFLFVYLLIALPVLQFALFWFYVNVSSFTLAFKDTLGRFTFDNFKEVWQMIITPDEFGTNLLTMTFRSWILWFITNVVVFPISLCTTYILFRKVFGHYVFRVIFILPSIIGGVVWVATMKNFLGYNGEVLYVLKKLGVGFPQEVLNEGLLKSKATAFPTLCMSIFVFGIAGGNMVVTGAYSRIPQELFEVGKLDGIGVWKEFFRVCLPCIWPTVSTLLTFSLCTMFVGEGNVYLYTDGSGGYGMDTLGFYIQKLVVNLTTNSASKSPYGIPATIGLLATMITLPIVLVGRYVLEKLVDAVES
mgnify:CR=1 FL=1